MVLFVNEILGAMYCYSQSEYQTLFNPKLKYVNNRYRKQLIQEFIDC